MVRARPNLSAEGGFYFVLAEGENHKKFAVLDELAQLWHDEHSYVAQYLKAQPEKCKVLLVVMSSIKFWLLERCNMLTKVMD